VVDALVSAAPTAARSGAARGRPTRLDRTRRFGCSAWPVCSCRRRG